MFDPAIRTVAGYMPVSVQMLRQIERDKCQEASDACYAITGQRSTCVCGQHANPVPLAPILLDDDDED